MTEAQLASAARAIRRVLKKTNGQAGPWSLAMAAFSAAGFLVSHETANPVTCEGKRVNNSSAKAMMLRARAIKGAATKRRLAAARAEAEVKDEVKAA